MAIKNPAAASESLPAVTPSPEPASVSAAPAATFVRLTLGQVVTVQVAEGVVLINNETGVPFVPGADTTQTVTPTLLRRIKDGDLALQR